MNNWVLSKFLVKNAVAVLEKVVPLPKRITLDIIDKIGMNDIEMATYDKLKADGYGERLGQKIFEQTIADSGFRRGTTQTTGVRAYNLASRTGKWVMLPPSLEGQGGENPQIVCKFYSPRQGKVLSFFKSPTNPQ